MKVIFSILLNAFILVIMTYLLGANQNIGLEPGIVVEGSWKTYLIGGIILGLINITIKPILKILSIPLFLVFFGLVAFVINGVVLKFLEFIINDILIIPGVLYKIPTNDLNGWINFIIAVTIFTVLNMLFSIFGFKKKS